MVKSCILFKFSANKLVFCLYFEFYFIEINYFVQQVDKFDVISKKNSIRNTFLRIFDRFLFAPNQTAKSKRKKSK